MEDPYSKLVGLFRNLYKPKRLSWKETQEKPSNLWQKLHSTFEFSKVITISKDTITTI